MSKSYLYKISSFSKYRCTCGLFSYFVHILCPWIREFIKRVFCLINVLSFTVSVNKTKYVLKVGLRTLIVTWSYVWLLNWTLSTWSCKENPSLIYRSSWKTNPVSDVLFLLYKKISKDLVFKLFVILCVRKVRVLCEYFHQV